VIGIPVGALLYSLEAKNNPAAHDGLIGPQLEDRGALKILLGWSRFVKARFTGTPTPPGGGLSGS